MLIIKKLIIKNGTKGIRKNPYFFLINIILTKVSKSKIQKQLKTIIINIIMINILFTKRHCI